MPLTEELERELAELQRASLFRSRRTIAGAQGPIVQVDGRNVLCLASNNYLGLANDPAVVRASIDALEGAGAGAGASPLISGHMSDADALERDLADWLGCEAALVFGSGYHANIGVIPALVGASDEIFSDELNHASLIDGCRLSRAAVTIYRHLDADDLAEKLSRSRARRRLVISDSIFSMDGDAAPLAEIAAAAERFGAWILLDEAHATGVFGADGAGLAAATGLGARVDVRMGTLGKALGSYGAFVAGSRALIDLLVNRARAYVYSTALPPAVVAAARAAIAIARADRGRRERLWRNARRLHAALDGSDLRVLPFASPIVALIAGEAEDALRLSRRALAAGVLAPAIRPPTVPPGTARLRLTPIATHDDAQIDAAVAALVSSAAAMPAPARPARWTRGHGVADPGKAGKAVTAGRRGAAQ
jgi:8-amino-7-oxononanoate synthase